MSVSEVGFSAIRLLTLMAEVIIISTSSSSLTPLSISSLAETPINLSRMMNVSEK